MIKKLKLKLSLARNFFQKLTNSDPSERYSANQAILHPWITRNPNDPIPFTIKEKFQTFGKKENLAKISKLLFFLFICKKKEGILQFSDTYKELVKY
jgi:serine/threonine protein kinase